MKKPDYEFEYMARKENLLQYSFVHINFIEGTLRNLQNNLSAFVWYSYGLLPG